MSDDALRAALDRLSMKAAVEINNGNDAEGWQAIGINYAIHEVRVALASSRPEPLDVGRAAETWTGEMAERNDANFTVNASRPEPLDVVAALKSYRGPFDVSLPIHHSVPLDDFHVERLTPLAEHLRAALASSRPEPLDSFSEHQRQSVKGSHLFDESCPICAALASSRPETLDAGRLARAIRLAEIAGLDVGEGSWLTEATAIAREYDRLGDKG